VSLKVSKAQTKLARQALSSKEFTSARILKYGLAALTGLISGVLVVRIRSKRNDAYFMEAAAAKGVGVERETSETSDTTDSTPDS
jgi:hypothetical protein